MRLFFDCEFSSFATDAQLISIGAVSECGGHTYYAELDTWLPEVCSEFVLTVVIPLLEHPPESRVSSTACRDSFIAWVQTLGEPIELVADSDWDWRMIQSLLGSRLHLHSPRSGWIDPIATDRIALLFRQFDTLAAELVFQKAASGTYIGRQHHALVDAMALRAGVLAVEGSYEGLA